jgi:hypothetical protein
MLHGVSRESPRARAYAVNVHGERPLPARPIAPAAETPATLPAVAEMRRLRLARIGGVRE